MAQQYTITKTGKTSATSTFTTAGPIEYRVLGDGGLQYYRKYSNPTNGLGNARFDFSEIPENATIISVNVGIQTTGAALVSTSTEWFTLWDEGGQGLGVFSNEPLTEYLQTGERKFTARSSFNRGGTLTLTQFNSRFPDTYSLTRTTTFTVTVTYEVADATKLTYGTKEGWIPCAVYYCDNGTYKPCRAYYGVNDEWKELG